jgi:hypothetical protein
LRTALVTAPSESVPNTPQAMNATVSTPAVPKTQRSTDGGESAPDSAAPC